MRRALLTILSAVLLIAWVVLSYAPATWLPHWQWPTALSSWMAGALVAGLIAFVAIQGWLVYATDRSLQAHPKQMQEFRLARGREGILTALPILLTVLFAWAAWPTIVSFF